MDDFAGQISDSSVRNLIGVVLFRANTEVFAFYESSEDVINDELGQALIRNEFSSDEKLALCHGIGRGHCFVRVALLREIMQGIPIADFPPDYATLVRMFRKRGYSVKRVRYAGSVRNMRAAMERTSVVGCVGLIIAASLLVWSAFKLFEWLF
ncbi:MAG: hypothetical protein U0941_11350 [Planctomycetaceae bacterium]